MKYFKPGALCCRLQNKKKKNQYLKKRRKEEKSIGSCPTRPDGLRHEEVDSLYLLVPEGLFLGLLPPCACDSLLRFAHRSLKAEVSFPPSAERFSAPFTVGRQEFEPSVFFSFFSTLLDCASRYAGGGGGGGGEGRADTVATLRC